jgi:hypothetical protein
VDFGTTSALMRRYDRHFGDDGRFRVKPIERVTRKGIEAARIRVTLARTISAVDAGTRKPTVGYIWWPEDNIARYEWRDGNPPPDCDRPAHLRGHRLVVDVGVIPKDVWDWVKRQRRIARRGTSQPTRMIDVVEDPELIEIVAKTKDRGLLPGA